MGIMDYNDHPIQFDRFFTGNHLRNFKFSDINGVILCRLLQIKFFNKQKSCGNG